MRFGIFDHVERRNDVGQAQQYEERLQFAATADAAGFYCYHVAETTIRPCVWHPTRPFISLPWRSGKRSACVCRHWSMCCRCITLSGSSKRSISLTSSAMAASKWGLVAAPIGPRSGACGRRCQENDARFEETLEVVLKGLRCEFLSHSGTFYNFKDLWMSCARVSSRCRLSGMLETPHTPASVA